MDEILASTAGTRQLIISHSIRESDRASNREIHELSHLGYYTFVRLICPERLSGRQESSLVVESH